MRHLEQNVELDLNYLSRQPIGRCGEKVVGGLTLSTVGKVCITRSGASWRKVLSYIKTRGKILYVFIFL